MLNEILLLLQELVALHREGLWFYFNQVGMLAQLIHQTYPAYDEVIELVPVEERVEPLYCRRLNSLLFRNAGLDGCDELIASARNCLF